jgi:small-conductance mechanosensitive channel
VFAIVSRIARLGLPVVLLLALSAAVDRLAAQQPPAQPAPPPSAAPPQGAPAQPGAAQPAPAQPAPPASILSPEVLEPVTRLARSVETAEKSIQQLKEIESELGRLRSDVERIIYDSTAQAEALRPQLAEARGQIEKLGPPPKAGEPPEPQAVADERARLNRLVGELDGLIKTAELSWVRAKQLIDRITTIRYQLFTRNLLERRDSPLLPQVWRDVGSRMETLIGRMRYYGNDWLTWAGRKTRELTALAGATLLVGFGLGWYFRRRVARMLEPRRPSPPFFERAKKAGLVIPLRIIAPLTAVAMLYFGLDELDLLFSPWNSIGLTALSGALVFITASALLRTAFEPTRPGWRLIPVSDATARRMQVAFLAIVGIYVFDTLLVDLARAIYAPLTVTVAKSFIVSLAYVAVLAGLLLTRFEPQIGPDRPVNGHEYVPKPVTLHSPLWVKVPLWLTAAVIIGASVSGYIALGRFVSHQLVLTGIVFSAVGLLYLAIRSATRGKGDGTSAIGEALGRNFGIEGSRRRQITRLVELTATLLLAIVALPVLMLQWGFSADDIRTWSKAALFGFEIGQFRISLVRILLGVALFTGLLFVTRMFQRWLREKVMTSDRMDAGISHSVDTAVGYVGTTLALLVAVSYAGFDITNLAIVASALAVGVGFGLQSIVNNFVSGLILLVERPVKVGDWIVLGSEQGNVRKISVRSTEIETFDRASLIVPNSELISGRVLNWTHRNQMGRTVVKLTLDPNLDPEKVLKILQACADSHPEILKTPKPFISFDSFSTAGLEFTIRVVVADVYRGGSVSTELRIAILKILREQGMFLPPAMPTAPAADAVPAAQAVKT